MADVSTHRGFASLPPEAQRVWLPAGAERPISVADDFDPAAAGLSRDEPFVAALEFDPAGEVLVRVNGQVMGELDNDCGAELSPMLRTLEGRGLTAVVEGAFSLIDGHPTISADPSPTQETASETADQTPTRVFAADDDAAAAALAADDERETRRTGACVRGLKDRVNSRAVLTLAAAVVLGGTGLAAYQAATSDAEEKMSTLVDSTERSAVSAGGAGSHTFNAAPKKHGSKANNTTSAKPSDEADASTERSTAEEPVPAEAGGQNAPGAAEPASNGAINRGTPANSGGGNGANNSGASANNSNNYAPPAPAPQPVVPAPAPAPVQAPAPAPAAPAAPANPPSGGGPAGGEQSPGIPLFQLKW